MLIYINCRTNSSIGADKKSADNLVKGVEDSKNIPFERVLYALGTDM
jgi:NAD-dependent DNA ligase